MSRADVNVLDVRRRLGRQEWGVPFELAILGLDDGGTWVVPHRTEPMRVLISHGAVDERVDASSEPWIHASIAHTDRMPSYDELQAMHRAIWPNGWAYQLFAPPAAHVNIHQYALHLFGRPDGRALLPNFGALGSI